MTEPSVGLALLDSNDVLTWSILFALAATWLVLRRGATWHWLVAAPAVPILAWSAHRFIARTLEHVSAEWDLATPTWLDVLVVTATFLAGLGAAWASARSRAWALGLAVSSFVLVMLGTTRLVAPATAVAAGLVVAVPVWMEQVRAHWRTGPVLAGLGTGLATIGTLITLLTLMFLGVGGDVGKAPEHAEIDLEVYPGAGDWQIVVANLPEDGPWGQAFHGRDRHSTGPPPEEGTIVVDAADGDVLHGWRHLHWSLPAHQITQYHAQGPGVLTITIEGDVKVVMTAETALCDGVRWSDEAEGPGTWHFDLESGEMFSRCDH